VKTTTAYLIHRFNWRDSSVIAHFLTPAGTLAVILKGVRRKKSPLATGLQSFVPLQMSFFGRSELKTARSLECLEAPPRFDYIQQACGLYANELIHALANEDSGTAVFSAYADLIGALPGLQGPELEWAMRHFERRLLSGCGYALSLPASASQAEQAPAQFYCYKPGTGLVPSSSSSHAKGVVSCSTLRSFLTGENGSSADLLALKQLMRQCMDDVLGGKKLRSRELLRPISAAIRPKQSP